MGTVNGPNPLLWNLRHHALAGSSYEEYHDLADTSISHASQVFNLEFPPVDPINSVEVIDDLHPTGKQLTLGTEYTNTGGVLTILAPTAASVKGLRVLYQLHSARGLDSWRARRILVGSGSPVQIAANPFPNRKTIEIKSAFHNSDVFIIAESQTACDFNDPFGGFEMAPRDIQALDLGPNGQVWALANSGSQQVFVAEI